MKNTLANKNNIINEIIPIIREQFQNKENFVKLLNIALGVNFSTRNSYEKLIEHVINDKREKEFCQKLMNSGENFENIIQKYSVWKATDFFSKDELIMLAEILSENGKKWKYDTKNIDLLSSSIIAYSKPEDLAKILPTLISEHKIFPLSQKGKWVVGPLGVTKSTIIRKQGYADDLVGLLMKYLTGNSIIEFIKRVDFLSEDTSFDKTDSLTSIKYLQLILTNGEDEKILEILNQLIDESIILIHDDEIFWDYTITPCGIFQEIEYDSVEKITEIILEEYLEKELETELQIENYLTGTVKSRLIEKCVKERPDTILSNLFGMPHLRKIARDLGLKSVDSVKNKENLIRFILLRLGFSVPRKLGGIEHLSSLLLGYKIQIKNSNSEESRGIINTIYVESEKILKDLIYFYSLALWPDVKDSYEPEDQNKEINKIIKKEKISSKSIERHSFGELVLLLEKINLISKKTEFQKIIKTIFKRDFIVSENIIELLKKINLNRARFAHDAETRMLNTTFNHDEIIDKLIEVCQELKDQMIYPIQFRMHKEITNEFGVTYIEAVDYNENNWIIKTDEMFLDTNRIHLMYSDTRDTAINPFIISKFW